MRKRGRPPGVHASGRGVARAANRGSGVARSVGNEGGALAIPGGWALELHSLPVNLIMVPLSLFQSALTTSAECDTQGPCRGLAGIMLPRSRWLHSLECPFCPTKSSKRPSPPRSLLLCLFASVFPKLGLLGGSLHLPVLSWHRQRV